METIVIKKPTQVSVNAKYPTETIVTTETKNYGESQVVTCKSVYEFPNRGKINCLYIAVDEDASYRWDEEGSKYYCVGRNYEKIQIIYGGNA